MRCDLSSSREHSLIRAPSLDGNIVTHSDSDLETVIRRKEMNRGQTTLLKCLYESEGPIRKADVIDRIREGDARSFGGVLGAFSNRVNYTTDITGSPGYEAFVRRREIDGEEHFELREEARKAIDSVPELQSAFERDMDALLDYQGVPIEFDS